ncbi:hypothetical protein J3R83DRAFT_6163, partial [Lanmaoa asiatica]
MVGHAYSKAKKKQIQAEKQEEAVAEACKIIQEEDTKPEEERRSRRQVCREVEAEWQKK